MAIHPEHVRMMKAVKECWESVSAPSGSVKKTLKLGDSLGLSVIKVSKKFFEKNASKLGIDFGSNELPWNLPPIEAYFKSNPKQEYAVFEGVFSVSLKGTDFVKSYLKPVIIKENDLLCVGVQYSSIESGSVKSSLIVDKVYTSDIILRDNPDKAGNGTVLGKGRNQKDTLLKALRIAYKTELGNMRFTVDGSTYNMLFSRVKKDTGVKANNFFPIAVLKDGMVYYAGSMNPVPVDTLDMGFISRVMCSPPSVSDVILYMFDAMSPVGDNFPTVIK